LTDKNSLPENFSWLEHSKIAGCGRPESEAELIALKEQGIEVIVSLTETPLNPETVDRFGFEYLHSHISGAPTIEQLDQILKFVEQKNAQSKPVLVHCGEGKGRTGTVLAAYLIHHGLNAAGATRIVREKRPGSIQTLEQEEVLQEFEKFMKQSRQITDRSARDKKDR
jgi:atypical dual specificity phosphatase